MSPSDNTGVLAVRMGFITAAQLQAVQGHGELGSTLVSTGALDVEQLSRVRATQRFLMNREADLKKVMAAVQAGVVSANDVKRALAYQKQQLLKGAPPPLITEILLNMDAVSTGRVATASVAAKPVAPVAAKPVAPVAAKPVAPVAAKPVAPVAAKPVAPVAAKPVAPVAAKPVAPVAAKPVAPVSVGPKPVAPAESAVPKPAPAPEPVVSSAVEAEVEAAPDETPDETPAEVGDAESKVGRLTLSISEDGLLADLRASRGFSPKKIEVHELLTANKIIFGVVGSRDILTWIKEGAPVGVSLPIAVGKAPVPPKHGRVEYFFDEDGAGIGAERADGTIDFSVRAEIPLVEEGACLARKHSPEPGTPGMDVRGEAIPVLEGQEAMVRAGKNVRQADDCLYASKPGQPERAADGKINVFPTYSIPGAVGPETGNVTFQGAVRISEGILPGYTVKAGTIMSREIMHARVESEGNVIIANGIVRGTVTCEGSVKARFIRDSTIEALGEVVVGREIVESTVHCDGALKMRNGRILGSTVVALKGIEVGQVGSDASAPSTLVVGVDEVSQKKLATLRAQIKENKAQVVTLAEDFELLERRAPRIEKDIARLAQKQDVMMVELREADEEIARVGADSAEGKQHVAALRSLRIRQKSEDDQMNGLFDEQEADEEKQEANKAEQAKLTEAVVALDIEVKWVKEGMAQRDVRAYVRITRGIQAGTIIKGPNSQMTIKQAMIACTIQEREKDGEFYMLVSRK